MLGKLNRMHTKSNFKTTGHNSLKLDKILSRVSMTLFRNVSNSFNSIAALVKHLHVKLIFMFVNIKFFAL